jgi:hypothetical protein
VTRDDIFAYQLGTGIIDPDFAPQLNAGPGLQRGGGPGQHGLRRRGVHDGERAEPPGPGAAQRDAGDRVDGRHGGHRLRREVSNDVSAMALNGNALYIGGQFTSADGTKEEGDARLNATTGAVDTTFSMPISDPRPVRAGAEGGGAVADRERPGTRDRRAFPGRERAARPRVALINTGGGLGTTATLADWAAPILANNCSNEHDDVRSIDFSPDGSFLVIGATGYKSSPANSASVCDAAARFPAAATGTDIQPTWINYTGGDSFYSVQVAGSVVYLGGHNRWVNNECGNNVVCEPTRSW